MRHRRRAGLALLAALLTAASAPLPGDEPLERLGGAATIRDTGLNAFGYPVPTLTATERRAFAVGNAFFKDNWVTAPASTTGRDGLGPLFNARSCSSCHLRDGRGRPPLEGLDEPGLLFRIGLATDGPDVPHPLYGAQLQDRAILGVTPEARIETSWTTRRSTYGDGEVVELAEPSYTVVDAAYGPLGDEARIGPRIAPQLIGLGLLEAIPAAAIEAGADPDDEDGDGVSGRAHRVRSARTGALELGRFGWKATQPTVEEQVAAAFVNDIGITSDLFPAEALGRDQVDAVDYESGGQPELDAHKLERVTFYTRVLAVPAQRTPADPTVVRGRALFGALGCEACHRASWRTRSDATPAAFRDQIVHPFTDLLLHDMGPELADEKHDGDATPSEWRTPPLWGIGLVEAVNGHTRFLHDGRARDLEEAVLWHGGEAEASRERFRALAREDRAALLAFLRSL